MWAVFLFVLRQPTSHFLFEIEILVLCKFLIQILLVVKSHGHEELFWF